MAANGFESAIQFRQRFVADFWLSLLDVVLTLGPDSPLYVPRQIGVANTTSTPGTSSTSKPFGASPVALWWDQPHLEFTDAGKVLLSIQVHGGFRQTASGRILSFDGPASALMTPLVRQHGSDVSYLGLQVESINLDKLDISYAGKALPPTRESKDVLAPLAEALQKELFERLAQLPLTFTNRFAKMNAATTRVRILGPKNGGAIIMGNAATERSRVTTSLQERLSTHNGSNFALTFSGDMLNQEIERVLASLRGTGSISEQDDITGPNGELLGKLDKMEMVLTNNGTIALMIGLSKDAVSATALIDTTLILGPNGELQVRQRPPKLEFETLPHPVSGKPGQPTHIQKEAASDIFQQAANMLAAQYTERVLHAVLGPQTLVQRFSVLNGQLKMEVAPTDLEMTAGSLTFYYTIPLKPPAPFVPSPTIIPSIMIDRPVPPPEAPPPDPFATTLRAEIITPSYPPYDYVWSKDGGDTFLSEHTPEITFTDANAKKSSSSGKKAKQPGVAASLAVIDSMGQVASVTQPVIIGEHEFVPLPPPIVPKPGETVAGALQPTEVLDSGAAVAAGGNGKRKRPRWPLIAAAAMLALLLCATCGLLQSATRTSGGIVGLGARVGFPGISQSTSTTGSNVNNPGGSSTSGPGSNPGGGGGGSATITPGGPTVTPGGPTVTPQPTATATPGQFTVSEVSIQQNCSLLAPPPSFSVTMYNQTANPVGFQVTINGTTWASANPNSGTLSSGQNQTVIITPNGNPCQILRSPKTYTLTIAAVSGATGTFTISDTISPAL